MQCMVGLASPGGLVIFPCQFSLRRLSVRRVSSNGPVVCIFSTTAGSVLVEIDATDVCQKHLVSVYCIGFSSSTIKV